MLQVVVAIVHQALVTVPDPIAAVFAVRGATRQGEGRSHGENQCQQCSFHQSFPFSQDQTKEGHDQSCPCFPLVTGGFIREILVNILPRDGPARPTRARALTAVSSGWWLVDSDEKAAGGLFPPHAALCRFPALGWWRIGFRILLHSGDHRVHSIFDLADLRMHFFDEVMLDLGQFLDAFALGAQLIQNGSLFA